MFVGRKREMQTLNLLKKHVEEGGGAFLILEGPAGIGKTSLLERFRESLGDWVVYRARARAEKQYIPYALFTEAFGLGSIIDFQKNLAYRFAREIARDLKSRDFGRVLIDEKRGVFAREIVKNLGGGLIVSSFSKGDVFITELDVREGVKPYSLDSEVLDRIIRFVKERDRPVVLIENLNYLIYTLGTKRVTFFLRDVISAMKSGYLIVSAHLDGIPEDERKMLTALFDDTYVFEVDDFSGDTVIMISDNFPEGAAVFSDERDEGYFISESSSLRPSMLNFTLLDKILEEMKSRDIVIKCLRALIDYNGKKEVYRWLKYIRDVALLQGRRIYLDISKLTPSEISFFETLADRSVFVREYVGTFAIYEAFLKYLENFAKRTPILVIFEDVQWSDANSMGLIEYISRSVPPGVLFIITYRGEEIALTEKAKIIRNMINYGEVEIIRLGPLKKEDAFLLMEKLGVENKEEIYERGGGNPLLIIELAKYEKTGERFIPDTIAESIEHQMRKVDDTTLYYLRFLAALGSNVEADVVREIMGDDALSYLEGNEFVEINESVTFKNTLIWEYLYTSTPPDLRVKFHSRIAEYYLDKSVFKAAYHLYKARRREAIEYLKKAAEKSREMYAMENAIDFYKQTLEIANKFGEEGEIKDILEKLADLEHLTGRYRDALKNYRRLLEIEESPRVMLKTARCLISMGEYDLAEGYLKKVIESGDEETVARAKESYGSLHLRRGNFEKAEKYMREFLDFARRSGNLDDLSLAYSSLSTLKFHQSKYKEALEFAKKSIEIAQKTRNYQQLIAVYNLLGVIYDVIGNPQKALEKYQILYELSKKAGDLRGMGMAYNNMGILYYTLGDLEMVKEYLEKALEINIKMGDIRSIALAYYNLSGVYAYTGDYHTGKEYIKKALNIYRKLGDEQHIASSELWLSLYDMWMGNYEEAKKLIENSRKHGTRERFPKTYFMSLVSMARIYLREGDPERALEEINADEELLEMMKSDADAYPEYVLTMAEIMLEMEKYNEAKKYIEEIKRIHEKSGTDYYLAMYHIMLSLLKTLQGESGERDFRIGTSLLKKQGYVSTYAESYYDYGRALCKAGKEEGKSYLKKAMDMMREMRLERRVEEIEKILGGCQKGI